MTLFLCDERLRGIVTAATVRDVTAGLLSPRAQLAVHGEALSMRVLVTYASHYGATKEIAERIAATLVHEGLDVSACTVKEAGNPQTYDAAIIGSASYFFHWMRPARAFVRRNRHALAQRPVWLFSSGPLGTKKTDAKGCDLYAVCEPREIAEFRKCIRPRDHKVFFGSMSPQRLGFFHRIFRNLPAVRSSDLLPDGDFRSWDEIEEWACQIAGELQRTPNILYETPTLTP
jgi:menaquinone-dependent protoporphyrinogen oxidase